MIRALLSYLNGEYDNCSKAVYLIETSRMQNEKFYNDFQCDKYTYYLIKKSIINEIINFVQDYREGVISFVK